MATLTVSVTDSSQSFENVMFTPYDSHYNFAYSTVATAPSPANSGTQLTLASGDGTDFSPGTYNATIWPAGGQPIDDNAEIVRVTGISGDILQIVRTQEGTTARSILVGDQIASSISVKTLSDVESYANPVGSISLFAGSLPPNGWLFCVGGTVSRTTYANLFAVIGTSFGTGDGSTTFGIPDLRGRSPMGAGTGTATGATAHALGSTPTSAAGGEETHTLLASELAAHDHYHLDSSHRARLVSPDAGSNASTLTGSTYQLNDSSGTATTGPSQTFGSAHNIMHPITAVNFIIKT